MARKPTSRARKARETPQDRRYRVYQEKHPDWRDDPHWKRKARGHREREHATRRERARAAGRLTERELAAVRRFALANAKRRPGSDPEEINAALRIWAQDKGFSAFEALKATRDRMRGIKRRRLRTRRREGETVIRLDVGPRSQQWDAMDAFAAEYDLPDFEWLFYH